MVKDSEIVEMHNLKTIVIKKNGCHASYHQINPIMMYIRWWFTISNRTSIFIEIEMVIVYCSFLMFWLYTGKTELDARSSMWNNRSGSTHLR